MALQVNLISDLVQKINQGQQKLLDGDESARLAMHQWASSLTQALENPYEGIMRLLTVDATTKAFVQVGTAVQLFGHLSEDASQALTSHELAARTGVEDSLLARILRQLAASGIVREAGPDRYYASAMAKALAQKKYQDIFKFYNTTLAHALGFIPEFLAKTGYRDPSDGNNTPFQMALNTDLHMFEYVERDAELAQLFRTTVLSSDVPRRAHWSNPAFYPVQGQLLSGLGREDGSILMVDIGGGMGLDLAGLHEAFPDPKNGRLLLQETEKVLSMLGDLPPRVEKMAHDFFQPQPVKGARAYYLHHIFHDWSDEKCREILLALKPAMTPRYSKVLIQDLVIPPEGASWFSTAADVLMMVGFAGKERTRPEFEALFESVGMKITGVWQRAPKEESLIEAILLESAETSVPTHVMI